MTTTTTTTTTIDLDAFWRKKHQENDTYWLTGSRFADIRSWYELPYLDGCLDLTEIGIGFGYMTKHLAFSHRVSAVDISAKALARVNHCALTYHIDRLALVTPADVAFCHLVFQHCPTDAVKHILQSVPLKPGGYLCAQTAWLQGDAAGLADDIATGGLIWHDDAEVKRLMVDAGLTPFWEKRCVHQAKGAVVHWYLFKARRESTTTKGEDDR